MADEITDSMASQKAGAGSALPGLLLAAVVAVVFLTAIFAFQVRETEYAIVTTFDRITSLPAPGLRFRLPYPIQKVYRIDKRLRVFGGNEGKIEETYTADGKNIIVGTYALYRVKEPEVFFKNVRNEIGAEDRLNSLLRNARLSVIGRHPFADFVNTDPKKMRMAAVESEILAECKEAAEKNYGIEVKSIGIKFLGLPESITGKVFERMKAEREKLATQYRAEGRRIAEEIQAKADKEKSMRLTEAEAEARRIRGEGDAKSAEFYAVFKKDPELAAFLRKLEALKKTLDSKTTLILDTSTPPFDLLGGSYGKLLNNDAPAAAGK